MEIAGWGGEGCTQSPQLANALAIPPSPAVHSCQTCLLWYRDQDDWSALACALHYR